MRLADAERQQSREIAVFDARHQGAVLVECTGQQHRESRTWDFRGTGTAVATDGLVFGGFAKRGVVVGGCCTPDVGDDRAFRLMHVAAAVSFGQRFVPRSQRAVAGDEQRVLLVDDTNHVQCLVGDTFAGSGGGKNETLQVRKIALAGRSVAEIEIRHTRAGGRECGHQ